MKRYTIYSLRLANELMKHGFQIIGTNINANNPKLKVFYFENTPELRQMVEKLK